MASNTIFIIGAGAFGTGLGQLAVAAGHQVRLVGRSEMDVTMINNHHVNSKYLSDIDLDARLLAQSGYEGLSAADLVLLAIPMQHMRSVLADIQPHLASETPILLCAKGLEAGSHARQSELVAALNVPNPFAILSGPGFASDIAQLKPTAMTIAADDLGLARTISTMMHSDAFRPYASNDVIGLELCGAIKNVMAIGCGAVEGAGLGMSARAALFSRAFAELGRLVAAFGGQTETLVGLGGLGDLTLTCTSPRSRNYAYGFALGQKSIGVPSDWDEDMLVEGFHTAPVAQNLARDKRVDTPIIDAVCDLILRQKPIVQLVAKLMARPLKTEKDV